MATKKKSGDGGRLRRLESEAQRRKHESKLVCAFTAAVERGITAVKASLALTEDRAQVERIRTAALGRIRNIVNGTGQPVEMPRRGLGGLPVPFGDGGGGGGATIWQDGTELSFVLPRHALWRCTGFALTSDPGAWQCTRLSIGDVSLLPGDAGAVDLRAALLCLAARPVLAGQNVVVVVVNARPAVRPAITLLVTEPSGEKVLSDPSQSGVREAVATMLDAGQAAAAEAARETVATPMRQDIPTAAKPRPALTTDRCPAACELEAAQPEPGRPLKPLRVRCCVPAGHEGSHLAWNPEGVSFEWHG